MYMYTVQKNNMELEKLLDRRRSRMMAAPGIQIYLWSRVTLNFDLLILKTVISCPCPN